MSTSKGRKQNHVASNKREIVFPGLFMHKLGCVLCRGGEKAAQACERGIQIQSAQAVQLSRFSGC